MDLARGENLVELPKFHPGRSRNASRASRVPGSQQTDGLLASPLSISISQANQNLVARAPAQSLLVTALIRQESQFEPKVRSVAGAGLMQVMPGTSKWVAEKINLKQYNTENPDNIQLGTWFLTTLTGNITITLVGCCYNAGPGNVSKLATSRERSR